MRDVSIVGVGQTDVAEHWEMSLRQLGYAAARAAMDDAGIGRVDALLVGNMLAQELSHQGHLGALLADFIGLRGIEAVRVEAAEASGGAALRQGYLAVASGHLDTAMVLGVEKVTDVVGSRRLTALATSLDGDYEASQGATPVSQAALLMQRYMHESGATLEDFVGFSVNAHSNGAINPHAMYRNRIKPEAFANAPAISPPVSLFDAAPDGDGAAAVILTTTERARDLVPHPVQIVASASATDTVSLHDRSELLSLSAAKASADRAYEIAHLGKDHIDLLELHDGFTVLAAMSLEACGFASPGKGCALANHEGIGLTGSIPISTFGGLKARGNVGGATGVYQAVEVVLQLRAQAGENQVEGAKVAMIQNLGGLGGTAITHILKLAED